MNTTSFARGIGLGIVVGSCIGMAVIHPPKKLDVKKGRSVVGKALKTVGNIVDNISDSMGM
jgi:hypothetical protein